PKALHVPTPEPNTPSPVARTDFPAGPGDQPSQDADVHALPQEMHRAVGKHGVGATGVEAVDLAGVGAVDRARPQIGRAVGRLALEDDPALEVVPGAAVEHLILATLAGEPAPGPAGILGKQDGVRGAVRYVCKAR